MKRTPRAPKVLRNGLYISLTNEIHQTNESAPELRKDVITNKIKLSKCHMRGLGAERFSRLWKFSSLRRALAYIIVRIRLFKVWREGGTANLTTEPKRFPTAEELQQADRVIIKTQERAFAHFQEDAFATVNPDINDHKVTAGVFLDLSKSFYTIKHSMMLNKLDHHGIIYYYMVLNIMVLLYIMVAIYRTTLQTDLPWPSSLTIPNYIELWSLTCRRLFFNMTSTVSSSGVWTGTWPSMLQNVKPSISARRNSQQTKVSTTLVGNQWNVSQSLKILAFFPLSVNIWSNLPSALKNCSSLPSLKTALSNHYLSKLPFYQPP